MRNRNITTGDICEITGFDRNTLRGLLDAIEIYKAPKARVAQDFSKQDLAVIVVCCELENRYEIRRKAIATIVKKLKQTLSGPRKLASNAKLVMEFHPPEVHYVEGALTVEHGLVVDLGRIFTDLDAYLSPERGSQQVQRHLKLGPVAIPPSKHTARASVQSPTLQSIQRKGRGSR